MLFGWMSIPRERSNCTLPIISRKLSVFATEVPAKQWKLVRSHPHNVTNAENDVCKRYTFRHLIVRSVAVFLK
jgi:hypothetical protein